MDGGVDETLTNAAESPAIPQPAMGAGLTSLSALAVGVLVMCLGQPGAGD